MIGILFLPILSLLNLPVGAETIEVKVFDYFFEPFDVSIHTGDTIEWVAYGFGHTVIADTRLFDSSTVWGSSIPALHSFKYTFHQPGVYPYYSLDYGGPEGVGMSAVISVSGPVTNQVPTMAESISPAAGSTNQPVNLELRSSPFIDPDGGDLHVASEWIVRRTEDGALAYDSGEVYDDGGVTSSRTNRFLPNQRLDYGTAYTWQVRYRDSYGAWGPYSAPSTFSTLSPSLLGLGQSSSILLAWPTNSFGFSLEYTTDALLTGWRPAEETPVTMNGQRIVTQPIVGPLRYYRPRKGPRS